jgi:hypothetical protein
MSDGRGRQTPQQLATTCLLLFALALLGVQGVKAAKEHHGALAKPMYHYGAKIPVECLDRNMYDQPQTYRPLTIIARRVNISRTPNIS